MFSTCNWLKDNPQSKHLASQDSITQGFYFRFTKNPQMLKVRHTMNSLPRIQKPNIPMICIFTSSSEGCW